jgi:hypothetical protein
MERVKDWIDGYRGKVIQISAEGEFYHLVFTKEKVSLRKGQYPSVDVTYLGSRDAIVKILKGETTGRAESRAGNIKIWNSLHETFPFEAVIPLV